MFAQNFKKWGSKLFMFHVSDYDETPHIELKKGKIKWGSILRKIRKTKAYGVCCETLYSKQDNIIYRAPKTSLINSLRFLQKVR
jgi:sugar phosphate isomerase/epimerase